MRGGPVLRSKLATTSGATFLVVLNIHCTFAQQPLLRREVLTVHKGSFREGSETTSGPPHFARFPQGKNSGTHPVCFCAAGCPLGPGIVQRTRVVSYPARAWLFSENGVTVRAGCATGKTHLFRALVLDSDRPRRRSKCAGAIVALRNKTQERRGRVKAEGSPDLCAKAASGRWHGAALYHSDVPQIPPSVRRGRAFRVVRVRKSCFVSQARLCAALPGKHRSAISGFSRRFKAPFQPWALHQVNLAHCGRQ